MQKTIIFLQHVRCIINRNLKNLDKIDYFKSQHKKKNTLKIIRNRSAIEAKSQCQTQLAELL